MTALNCFIVFSDLRIRCRLLLNICFLRDASGCIDIFYQLATMFDLSVDEYFYPDMGADEAAKKRINIQLNSLNESELRLVEGIINAIIENRETEGAYSSVSFFISTLPSGNSPVSLRLAA